MNKNLLKRKKKLPTNCGKISKTCRKKERMAEIGENRENKGNERQLRKTGCVTKGFALAGLASMPCQAEQVSPHSPLGH